MQFDNIPAGKNPPEDVNVAIEIPANSSPVKYELDKDMGAVIRARPVGVLNMEDEAGGDAKLVAVPHDKLTTTYHDVKEITDLPELLRDQIKHFFENYKTLEPGKWVKVQGWDNAEAARKAIVDSVNAYKG